MADRYSTAAALSIRELCRTVAGGEFLQFTRIF